MTLMVGKSLTQLFNRPRPKKRIGSDSSASIADLALPPGFLRIEERRVEDIFVCGFPKSGNTWLQAMVAGALYGLELDLTHDSLIQDLVPDVHYRKFYKRYASPTFFKSHALPCPDYRNVVYILRDGRDAMVSYFHHLAAELGREPDFLSIVRKGTYLFPCKWHEHVEQWLSNPCNCRMMVVRYEDMKTDPLRELVRVCEFARLERESTLLERVVRQASFGNMQKREQTQGWDNQNWPKDKPFIRTGKVGGYNEGMPAEVLEAFTEEAGPLLRRVGYMDGQP